jgi:hypothetical protein
LVKALRIILRNAFDFRQSLQKLHRIVYFMKSLYRHPSSYILLSYSDGGPFSSFRVRMSSLPLVCCKRRLDGAALLMRAPEGRLRATAGLVQRRSLPAPNLKFTALHQQLWHVYICEIFSSGSKTEEKTLFIVMDSNTIRPF